MLRAVDQFHSEFRAYPGYFQDQVETDIVRLKVSEFVHTNRYMIPWSGYYYYYFFIIIIIYLYFFLVFHFVCVY